MLHPELAAFLLRRPSPPATLEKGDIVYVYGEGSKLWSVDGVAKKCFWTTQLGNSNHPLGSENLSSCVLVPPRLVKKHVEGMKTAARDLIKCLNRQLPSTKKSNP